MQTSINGSMANIKDLKHFKFSICTFNNGEFDIMILDPETLQEIIFSGKKELSEEELQMTLDIAPACVWTDCYSTHTN